MMNQRNTFFNRKWQINCRGKLLDLDTPKIMGVLNVTPDSFYDGGKYTHDVLILKQAEKMLQDGASIIDIGGMSSRPGAAIIEVGTELQRVIPVIEAVVKEFPDTIVSIDTIRAKVVKEAVEAGAGIVNDISAGSLDVDLLKTVGSLNVPYILMHMQGKPKDMQLNPSYKHVVQDMIGFFVEKIEEVKQAGIKDVVIDPGFGFGKTLSQNYQILQQFDAFRLFDLPLLAGMSRKSMICKLLDVSPSMALNGTTATNMVALQRGASILRVHDVKEAMETVKIAAYLKNLS
ncbi:MAG: dihydropteroate synthase [Chitinophagales bacterium]